MKKLAAWFSLAAFLSILAVAGCSDKNSLEACQYQTTINLDKGNYDAVLASSCATPLQVGAAYFGKAGFSVTKATNALVTAKVNAETSSLDKSLREYMTSLIGKVSNNTITFLDLSRTRYAAVPPADEFYKDAQFDLSIVDAIKALCLIKTVIDLNGLGTLSTCDINGNGKPDEADATSCGLVVSGATLTGGSCPDIPKPDGGVIALSSEASYTTTTSDLFFTSVTGTYRGMTVTMTGTATGGCPATYQKLLYRSAADGKYYLATTSGFCLASDGNDWPCPVTSNLDMVGALQTSIIGSIDALNSALTTTGSDLQTSIQTIKNNACGIADAVCSPSDIAKYLQDNL